MVAMQGHWCLQSLAPFLMEEAQTCHPCIDMFREALLDIICLSRGLTTVALELLSTACAPKRLLRWRSAAQPRA